MQRLLKVAIGASGGVLIAWAFMTIRFRDVEGFLDGRFCLPLTAGISVIVLAAAIGTRWLHAALWLVVCALGQAISLQMIDAGNRIHYQHYIPITELIDNGQWPLLAMLGAQLLIVSAGLWRGRHEIRASLGCAFKPWQIVAIACAFYAFNAAPSRDAPFYAYELVFAGLIQTVNLGALLLLAMALPDRALDRLKGWFDTSDESHTTEAPAQVPPRRGISISLLVAAACVTAVTAFLSVVSYQCHPHLQDEVGYFYHAKYFAAGLVALPPPPTPKSFEIYLMALDGGHWYSIFPPGWPAALAVGFWIGVPWLINPILAGVNVVLVYLLARDLYDRATARLVTCLFCSSPWFVFMGMSFMSHTLALACVLAACLAVSRARKTKRARWAAIGGAVMGVIFLIRPLDGALVSVLVGLWAIGVGARALKLNATAALVLATAAVASLHLIYNHQLTGNPASFPLETYYEQNFGPGTNALGFGPERGLGWGLDPYPGHSPLDAAINAVLNLSSISTELHGWGIGSLLFVAVIVFSRAMHRTDRLMLGVIAAFMATYSLYWFSGGPDFGARYWYLAIFPLVCLTARGVQHLGNVLNAPATPSSRAGGRVVAVVIALMALTLINYFPWRAIDKYHHYLNMRPDIPKLAAQHQFGRSLVLIRGAEHPDFASAFAYNPINLRADAPVYAFANDPHTQSQVLTAYRDRPIWVVDGPTLTGKGFEVVAGPLSADAMLAQPPLIDDAITPLDSQDTSKSLIPAHKKTGGG